VEECSHLTQLLRTVSASPKSGIVGIDMPLVSPVPYQEKGLLQAKSFHMRGHGLSIFQRYCGRSLRQHTSFISHGLSGPDDMKKGLDGGCSIEENVRQ
jgi:hypothetical protein